MGIRLKELRDERGITQQEIANKTKISRSVLSQYENGIVEPTANVVSKLADFFGISTDYLLGRTDEFGYVTVQSSPAIPRLTESERYLLEWFRALPSEEARRSFLSFIQSDKKSATKRN